MKVLALLLASTVIALPQSSFIIQNANQRPAVADQSLGDASPALDLELKIEALKDRVDHIIDLVKERVTEIDIEEVALPAALTGCSRVNGKLRASPCREFWTIPVPAYEVTADSEVEAVEGDDEPSLTTGLPIPAHHPPVYLDFSNLTINEILNKTLHHHHDHEHEHEARQDALGHDKWDNPAYLPLHRLAWLVNKSSDAQESLEKKGITLLAPDDHALTPPHRRGGPPHHHRPEHEHEHEHELDGEMTARMHEARIESLEQPLVNPIYHVQRSLRKNQFSAESKDDDKDKERRKRFEHIIAYILKYHILPEAYCGRSLASKSTVGTELNTSRIKVEPTFALFPHPYPTIKFNGYAYKRMTVKAKNGLIHLIGAPLLPPLSPLNQLFLFPQGFSTLTSDLQRVDLADALLPHYHQSQDGDVDETSLLMDQLVDEIVKENNLTSFTIFAPTNFAFARLGPKIVALLHSPFPLSKRILKYVLSYHVVPDVTFYSDFVKGAKPSDELDQFIVSEETDVDIPLEWIEGAGIGPDFTPVWPNIPFPRFPDHGPHGDRPHHPEPQHKANVTRYELPTLLAAENKNATLKVLSVAYRRFGKGPVRRAVVVLPNKPSHHDDEDDKENHEAPDHHPHGPPPARPVRVIKADIPARSGAIQVVTTLLRPPMPHHDSASFGKPSAHPERKFKRGLAQLFD